MINEDRLLTSGEVAKVFRVDPKTVARWATAGRINTIRTPGGHRRYRESEVRARQAGDRPPMVGPLPADSATPSPEEAELMGLGLMVSIMSRLTGEERLSVLDFLGTAYGHLVEGFAEDPYRVELGYLTEAQNLTDTISSARLAEIRFGSHALARIIMDAGWRKVKDS